MEDYFGRYVGALPLLDRAFADIPFSLAARMVDSAYVYFILRLGVTLFTN